MKNVLLIIISLIFFSCHKEDIPETKQRPLLHHDNLIFFNPKYKTEKQAIRKYDALRHKGVIFKQRIPKNASVILLDFDGGITQNTSWNASGAINYQPANLTQEQQKEIYDRVVLDYAPFDVYVTTDERVYQNANPYKRIRVAITVTNEWYGNTAGGVAYNGSFTWGNDTPCWVFSALINYNTKNIARAVSHEIGHTLYLRHQALWDEYCNLISSYNPGTLELSPIMGFNNNSLKADWWVGPTALVCPYATNYIPQNDKEIIASIVGYK
jgi:hypothetical protein